MVLRANFCIYYLWRRHNMTSLRWHFARQLFSQLSSLNSPLSFSSCQLELYRDPEVLCCCGVGRRGQEGFVELAVVVGRHGDEL